MGRDVYAANIAMLTIYFNPLSPHGERLVAPQVENFGVIFQSTLPAWGETHRIAHFKNALFISIHSPRMGRDNIQVHKI